MAQHPHLSGDLVGRRRRTLHEAAGHDASSATARGEIRAYAEQPGGDIVRDTSGGMFLDQSQKRLLDQVIGEIRVPRQRIREARQPTLVLVVRGHDEVRASVRGGFRGDPPDGGSPPAGGVDLVLHGPVTRWDADCGRWPS